MSVLSPPLTTTTVPRTGLDRLHDWVTTVDHKRLGVMYVAVGLLFFMIAGLEATMMRLQLAWPGLQIVPPETFNRLFTMHGTTMVFLVGIRIVFGFGNYLVPLMIGARDLAFPRLNAFGFWVLLFGGLLLHFSVVGGDGRMVRLRAPHRPGVHAGQRHRLLEPRGDGDRVRHHRHRAEPGHHHPDHAWARDDPGAHADLCVGDADRLSDDPDDPAPAVRGPDHAAAGSLPGRPLLRHPSGRLRGDVAALLLVLRPPRGLPPDVARLRLRLRDHPRVLAQGPVRLHDDCDRHGVHRRGEPQCVGPPHVRGRDGGAAEHLLRGLHDAD